MNTSTRTPARPATEKQLSFISKLSRERGRELPTGELSTRDASRLIDELMAAPRVSAPAAPGAAPVGILEPGMYRAGADLFRVYPARNGGHLLAKRVLTGGGFEYAGAATRFVAAAGRLTREEAAAWGQQYGVCCVCAAHLTDPESVAAGIGPICGNRV